MWSLKTSTARKSTSSRRTRLGAVINDDTVPQLKAKVVAGAANNI
jgi:hypothetical protein